MRETVTVQVGQCGNAIGNSMWQMLLKEHEKTPDDDDAMSAFFRHSDTRSSRGGGGVKNMKARAF